MTEKQKIKVIEIAFTGYSVTDLKRARDFYEGTLGLKQTTIFGDDNVAWIEYDIGPGTLAISNMAPEWKPSPSGGAVALEVEDFAVAISRMTEDGVTFLFGPTESPVCNMVVVSDPDGNSVTIHKRKAEAAK